VSDKIYLTIEGVKKLETELKELRQKKRPDITTKLNEARELGDLKENAEYHAAKEQLAICDNRISKIQETLAKTELIHKDDIKTDGVHMFSKVTLKNMKTNSKLIYTLVSQEEADLNEGKISISSPVGKGLVGHKKGEIVEITVPAGKLEFEILDIAVG
jgi:transcription elongation factor GreA